MPNTPKKPAPPPTRTAGRHPEGARRAGKTPDPRHKPDTRWQRAKRYGWDGR